ncbi:c-type cytochrome biogenesis protein CcmI [Ancylobacter defluvii]|uniref:Cytochrome c-type biogenesis protein CycH n=1 Tax=Ancylobacter defluvii TaxID=1282440 RepID=A0A9W6JZS3_9HYPH|nr:c-type cytochrome biogenesis protein CcmI [Ancylobacter defluvii]MBS7589291.1 c-type cytochrome biogenesis protein CcmI [Ancylobacter defluvii]GLK84904.1 cytochrome c-type biogenesis protein CycH [Ancylobacter defluvii]
MLLWLAISLMTGAAIMAVLWPLRPRAGDGVSDGQADLAVYRDQLAEIERDRAAGLIGAAEGEAARTELARRMLRVAEADAADVVASGGDRRRRVAAVVALIGVPLFAGGLYFALGSPQQDGQPLAARLDAQPGQADVAILVRRVEDHLTANPDDGRGYEVIAPVYMRVGRFEDAARAWTNAIRLNGSDTRRQNGLGEALLAQSGGVVTAEAKVAFEAARTADPADPRARYFLGLAAEQDGRPQEAAAMWSALAADSPADAPWRPMLATALARVGAPVVTAPGPNAQDVAAAQQMSAEERGAMVRGMVDRLSQRLAENGNDLDGWLRLMRAWNVLGEGDEARAAAAKARVQFAADTQALGRIDALARELGLGS